MNENKLYYTGEELLKREVKEIPMLWKPFIQQTGLIGLTGSSDTGKSILLRQLAIAVCLRKDTFLNYPLNSRFGTVIYISTEDSEDAISASLSKQLKDVDPRQLNGVKFIFNQQRPGATLLSILKQGRVDLIIIDAWADLFEGNPNDVVQVRKSLNRLTKIAQKNECAIIILHHTVKNSEYHRPDKNKLNGSQGIEAKLRVLLELRQNENDERTLSVLKGNYISSEIKKNSLLIRFDEERLLFFPTGKTIAKNTILSRGRETFGSNMQLTARIVELREGEELSYPEIRQQLVIEFGEEGTPSLTLIKNIYASVSQNVA